VDQVYVRKWVVDEPTHGVWSIETAVTDGWSYRKSHIIHSSTGAGTEYQVRITAHSSTGTDSDEDVYLNNNAQNDFSDVRFAYNKSGNGMVWLKFCRMSLTATKADYWVRVAEDLTTDNRTVYIYYGNEEATYVNDPEDTFLFFDDFEDAKLRKWYEYNKNSCNWTIVSDVAAQGSNAAFCKGGWANRSLIADLLYGESPSTHGIDHGIMIHVWSRANSSGNNAGYPGYVWGTDQFSNQKSSYVMIHRNSEMQYYQDSTVSTWPYNYSYSVSTWYEFEIGVDPSTDKKRAWKDGSNMGITDLLTTDGNSLSDIDSLYVYSGTTSGYDLWIDEYYVRKWVESEPVHGSWGSEESL
jgi:hypothetical protein